MSRIDTLKITDDPGFRTHAIVFAAVMTLLVVINLFHMSNIWVHWPLLGWGLGLAFHGAAVNTQIKRLRAEAERRRGAANDGASSA